MKNNSWLYSVVGILIFCLVIFLGVSYEIWRWHTFQEVTHSHIGFWKWTFLFSHK
jgi:hypothetical protein